MALCWLWRYSNVLLSVIPPLTDILGRLVLLHTPQNQVLHSQVTVPCTGEVTVLYFSFLADLCVFEAC